MDASSGGMELAVVSVGVKVDLEMFQRGLDSVRQQLGIFDQQASSGGIVKTQAATKALGADTVTTAANLRSMSAATSISTRGLLEHEAAVGLNRVQMLEAGHVARSFFDIIASGGSPLRALELEGTRVFQIFAEGNGGIAGTFRALAPILLPVAGIAAAVGLGFAGLTYELDKTTGKNITFMETIKATGQAVWKDFTGLIGPGVKQVGSWFGQLVDFIAPGVKMSVNFIIGGFVGAFHGIKDTWSLLPAAMGDIVIQAANGVISGTQGLINGAIGQLNSFIALVNDKLGPLGVKLGTIGQLNLGGGIANPFAGSAAKAGRTIGADMQSAMSTDYAGKFYGQVQDFALKDYAADQLGKLSKAANEAAKKFAELVSTGKDNTASLQAQAASLGRTTEQTAYLEESTKLLNKARQDGLKLSPQQLNQLDGEAKAYARAKMELDELTQVYDIGKSSFEGFFSTLKTGFQNGETAIQAFGDAAGKVLDELANKALQMAADGIWNSIFGALGGGSGGGLLGNLFGLRSPISAVGAGIAGGVLGHASGGMIRGAGTGTSDSIPSMLSDGEYVINARAAAANRGLLDWINAGGSFLKRAGGGLVAPGGESGPELVMDWKPA